MKTLIVITTLSLLAIAACAVGNGDPSDLRPEQTPSPTVPGALLDAAAADEPRAREMDPSDASDAATLHDASSGPHSATDASLMPASADAGVTCADYAEPTVAAACHACGSKPCQMNGCYNGYWCNTVSAKCQAKPVACS